MGMSCIEDGILGWLSMDLSCNRCGHSWYSRTPNEPKVCPKCKSPYWNKKRVKNESKSDR